MISHGLERGANFRGHIDDADDDERNSKANCNPLAVVFMLSGFLNLGAPLQTPTLATRV